MAKRKLIPDEDWEAWDGEEEEGWDE